MTLPDLPHMDITPPSHSPLRNLSWVWLAPLFALLVTLGVAWKSYNDRGTLVTITFPTATGVIAGETSVKYRDVVIGQVEDVRFTKDLKKVVVAARIDKDVAETLPADSQFWVVSPKVSANGISGLSTVLSGVYIEGAWLPTEGTPMHAFAGLASEPMVRPGRQGTRIKLRSKDGSSLPEGGPIFFRGVEVGKMDVPKVTESGDSAIVEAFIHAPNDRFLTTATRFWDTSGFSVKLGAGGLDLSVSSIGALVRGGVAFDTTFAGGAAVDDSTVFNLFIDEDSARQSIFNQIGDEALPMAVIFSDSVNGLQAGAPVEYRGLRVGQVTGINAFIDAGPNGRKAVKMRATVSIDPQALGLDGATGKPEVLAFLEQAVQTGLRARLATSSIFSASLKVELAELPDEEPAKITLDADGVPVLPSVDSDLPDVTATAEGVMKRINDLPIEEVMNQAITLMASIEALAADEGTRAAPDALVKLLEDSRALVNKEDTQAIPSELRGVITDLRTVVADLQTRGAMDHLASLLESADKAASRAAEAAQDFPQLVADLRDLAAKAKALKTDELVASTTTLIDSANAMINTDAARALPADLSAALAQVQAALQELREGGAITNTNAALASAKDAADAVAIAANDLPKLTAELNDLLSKADALVAAYGAKSPFNAETLALLREFKLTAKSVTQLARTIERNPNSLLIGR